jgi:hypothetical protein
MLRAVYSSFTCMQALYRGNGANVMRVVPEVMLKFGIHDQLRAVVGVTSADPSELPLSSRITAASLTGLLRAILLQPLSVIRTRLTADLGPPSSFKVAQHPNRRTYHGIRHCIYDIWKRKSLHGFYQGFTLAAVSSVPYLTVCFSTYDLLLEMLPKDKHSMHEWWYPIQKMGCAAGVQIFTLGLTRPPRVGSVAWWICQPNLAII